jgi:hypothetical protein
MFRVILPTIIRIAYNCIYSIWYLSHRYSYLPLSWRSWNWFECAIAYLIQYLVLRPSSGALTTVPTASGICQTVTATYRYRGGVGTGLSVLLHTQTSTWYLRPSSGAHTTVSTASGICQTITATCRYSSR